MFFFPLSDDNPTHRRQLLTWVILGLCVAVFFWQSSLGAAWQDAIMHYGFIPAHFFGYEMAQNSPPLPASITIFTSMFLHGGWMHLIGNMLYLWIFADNVEESMGWGKFIVFYGLCGCAAAVLQAIIAPSSPIPMIGASGAIAGVLGAYLILYPRANIRCLVGIFIFFRLINVPAFLVLGGWFFLQFLNLGAMDGQSGGVAYFAHIGGFIAGVLLIPFFKKPHIRLFAPAYSDAFALSPVSRSAHVPVIKRTGDAPPARDHPWDD